MTEGSTVDGIGAFGLSAPGPELLEALRARLGPGGWRAPDDAPGLLEEPRGRFQGRAALIARPADAESAAEILRLCAAARAPVVPYGGGTGLVGGQVAPEGCGPAPVVLSLERLNRIRVVDADDDVAIVEAGVPLSAVRAAADDAERLFPLNLASRDSAQIGGLLATNAGGVAVLRYGSMRDLCLGLEAALPSGRVWNGLKRLRKNNMGYDLRNLLIGSEGTLGVITAACLKLAPRPRFRETAMVALARPEQAVALLRRLQGALGETISAFELIAEQSFAFLRAHAPEARPPFSPDPPWAALVEIASAAPIREAAMTALAEAMEALELSDATLAENARQREALWALRETIPIANRRVGAIASHDVSVPVSRIAGFVARAGAALAAAAPELRINCFGHIGDGNLHYNLFPPEGGRAADYRDRRAELSRIVHDLAHDEGGSISAEHGIGRLKTGELARYGDPAALEAMRAVKAALDPCGIMNPGALFAAAAQEDGAR